MNIVELGAIGELVGGVAVIGSLIYVGLQLRQSTEQARQSNAIERAQAARDVTHDFNEIMLALRDPGSIKIFRRGITQFDQLPPDEQAGFHQVLTALVVHATSAFLVGRDRLLDEQYTDAWIESLASLASSPGVRQWWDQTKVLYHQEFVSRIDDLVLSSDGHPPIHVLMPWFAPEDISVEA